jgi:hypothetical protein
MRWRDRLPFFLLLLAIFMGLVPPSGLTPQGYYEARLAALTGPDTFSLSWWTVKTVVSKGSQVIAKPGAGMTEEEKQQVFDDFFATSSDADELEGEIRYLAAQGMTSSDAEMGDLERKLRALRNKREAQSGLVERIIQDQVQAVLKQQNLSLVQLGDVFFPPVIFKLVDLPRLLVVAHRDRFETRSQVFLRRNISTEETTVVEDTVDQALNVRSLTVWLGGLGTYPTMVGSTAQREWLIGVVAHEWCHVYLQFRPLGLSYGKTGELTAMNETVCGIVEGDAGALVLQTYYGAEKKPRPWEAVPTPTPTPGAQPTPEPAQSFNANRELRKVYLAAEERLKAKDIEGAEAIMEQGRQLLAANGYYERKLNQAFFAFYGSYAAGTDAIRPDLIGDDLRELRRRSPTLRDFMVAVAGMDSYDDLKRALGK